MSWTEVHAPTNSGAPASAGVVFGWHHNNFLLFSQHLLILSIISTHDGCGFRLAIPWTEVHAPTDSGAPASAGVVFGWHHNNFLSFSQHLLILSIISTHDGCGFRLAMSWTEVHAPTDFGAPASARVVFGWHHNNFLSFSQHLLILSIISTHDGCGFRLAISWTEVHAPTNSGAPASAGVVLG